VDRLDVSQIADGLYAGRMPYAAAHIAALAERGVEVVVNVCEDHEYWDGERALVEPAMREAGIAEARLPVPDGATVPPAVLDAAVAATDGRVAYVHCRGGRERSAAVTVAILAAGRGVSVDEALELAVAGRPTFKPLEWQLDAVRSWLRDGDGRRMLAE
jgi:atypical dual specificity phosphatase